MHSLTGLDDPARLHDRTQWRVSVQAGAQIGSIRADPAGLTLATNQSTQVGGGRLNLAVFPVDALTPVPVVRTPVATPLRDRPAHRSARP